MILANSISCNPALAGMGPNAIPPLEATRVHHAHGRRGGVATRGARAAEVAAGSLKMDKDYLVLKRASVSRSSGEWSDDDFDVLCDGVVVGRIMKAAAVPVGMSWMWTLAYDYHEDRTLTHGYAATCEDATAAFAKSWRRE
jgi:hypothetical protein